MKKIILLFSIAILSVTSSRSASHLISVEDFEFDPAFLTVNVGDTIVWIWDEGTHTTTSSTIPLGATTWNSPITSSNPVFMYVITQPGQYLYECLPHASMGMQGLITANGTVGLNENTAPVLSLNPRVIQGELIMDYAVTKPTTIAVCLYDMTGKEVKQFEKSYKAAGNYNERYSLFDLPRGVYLLRLETPGDQLVRKITVN
jgi:plastocyanin